MIDPRTDERRRAVLADIADFARVCDALPSIDFIMCMGIASDVDRPTAELHHALAMLRNTTKPFVFTALDLAAAQKLTAMFDVVAGGREALRERPFALMYNEPVSPLGFARDNMEKLLFAAEMGVPSVFMSGLLCGGTAPVTPAGGLVLGNAESLAGVLIAQLKRKGAPVVSGGGILGMDMRTMAPSYSTPEFMLTMAAMAELAQYYGLPAWGYAGCSDAKTFDAQAAADTAEWVLMAALSGSNLVARRRLPRERADVVVRPAGVRRRGDREVRPPGRRHRRRRGGAGDQGHRRRRTGRPLPRSPSHVAALP